MPEWDRGSRDAYIVDRFYNYWKFGYTDRPKQSQLAHDLQVSIDTVADAIKNALQPGGFARVLVDYSGGRHTELEQQLAAELGSIPHVRTKAIRVVATPSVGNPWEVTTDHVRRMVGQVASQLLVEEIMTRAQKAKTVIGLSWGRTIRCMVEAMPRTPAPAHEVHLVPTAGGFGGGELAGIESGALVSEMCHRLGFGQAHNLPAPGYVTHPDTQEDLFSIPLTKHIVSLWTEASVIVSGIGAMEPGATSLTLWQSSGFAPESHLQLLEQELDVVGDISLHFFTRSGKGLPSPDDRAIPATVRPVIRWVKYPISLDLEELKRAAGDPNRLSLAVAAGKDKALPLMVAITTGLVSGIVVDQDTAEEMLSLWLGESWIKP